MSFRGGKIKCQSNHSGTLFSVTSAFWDIRQWVVQGSVEPVLL
jgi:hypothetical protein